ncbi:MAG: bifunctional 3,4-dihydroxy-2-butanone-4-phosphate synthase/GTP cyclohydrolase II [Candidatus Dormibacteraeota bacterium]|nr:bifunctional 3,4-dihydroxy-2-butanone-4-phosphate synthase/GTP cyclohydrolase II [Candidatus Dormibacteraeota bacterium]
MTLATIPEVLADLEAGKFVIVVDDEDREGEGDLMCAADLVTPEHIAFMAKHASGLIVTAMTEERLDELQIEPMVSRNTERYGTAFAISVEAKDLVTTGISAQDRAATVRHLVNPGAKPADFAKPGHTFPLRARPGGVLVRTGHTEAAVDLCSMAGFSPAGVLCEVMNDDGTMARLPQLEELAAAHDLKMVAIKDLVAHRRRTEKLVAERVVAPIPIEGRIWQAHAFEDLTTGAVHVALVLGDIDPGRPVLLRVHSRCLTGDVFGSQRCDCGPQLAAAMDRIAEEGAGLVLYITDHEGRGIGLVEKLRAYNLQDEGLDTVEANLALHQPDDSRDYGIGNQILAELGVRRMRLLTNNPRKLVAVEGFGLEVVEQVPLRTEPNHYNERYLATKREKLGHLL